MSEIVFGSGEIVEIEIGDESKNDRPGPVRPPADQDRALEVPLRNYRIRFNWDEPDEDRQSFNDYSFTYSTFSSTAGLSLNNGITKDVNDFLELTKSGVTQDVNGVFRTTSAQFNCNWSMSFRVSASPVSGSSGEGWALVWASTSSFIGASGGAVGYFASATPSTTATKQNTRAIAFRQSSYRDAIYSVEGAKTTQYTNVDWTSDYYYWLDYNVSTLQMKLYRALTNIKPASPLYTFSNVDFESLNYYVGFTAATSTNTMNTLLKSWSLSGAQTLEGSGTFDEDDNEGLAPGQSHAVKYKVEVQKKTLSGWQTVETDTTRNTHYVFHAPSSMSNADLLSKYRARIWSMDADGDLSSQWMNSNNGTLNGDSTGTSLGEGDGANGTGGRQVRVFNKVGQVRKREYENKWHADRNYRLIKLRAVVGKHDPELHPDRDGCPIGSSIKLNIRKYDADYDDDIYTDPSGNGFINLFLNDAKMEIPANKHRDVAWITEDDPDLRWTTILMDESIAIKVSQVGSDFPGSHLRVFMTIEAI